MRRIDDPVRFSHLKAMAQSPAHYKHSLASKLDSDEISVGLAVHSMVLGGDRVAVFADRRDARTEKWRNFMSENEGKIILKPEMHERAEAMATAVLEDANARALIDGAAHEVQVDWERAGRKCSSRLDGWHKRKRYIFDLKTCRTANPDWFQRIAQRMHYHAQCSWYLQAAEWDSDVRCLTAPEEAYLIAVESKAPFPVTVHKLTEATLAQGRTACSAWFEQLMVCESSGFWPGYTQSVVEWDIADETPALDFSEVEQ